MARIVTHNWRVRAFSAISGLLGIWLILSPRLLQVPSHAMGDSAIIVGALVVLCALIRFSLRHSSPLSWVLTVLGAWTIASPWILGFVTGDARTWSYVIVGILLAGMETYSLTSSATNRSWSANRDGVSSTFDESRTSENERASSTR
jgi:hypothetical protein